MSKVFIVKFNLVGDPIFPWTDISLYESPKDMQLAGKLRMF